VYGVYIYRDIDILDTMVDKSTIYYIYLVAIGD
jgi:hypothetical protein